VDIAHGEMVERELDSLITRRSKQKDPEEASDTWQESERRHEEQRRLQARYEWHLHHTAQAERLRRTLEVLVSHHEQQAAKLMDIQPKGAA
jgi:aspartokinase